MTEFADQRMKIFLPFILCLTTYARDGVKELRLLGLMQMTGEEWPAGWMCVVPIQMAIDKINAHPTLLSGYKLTFDYYDDQCIPGDSVFKMVQKLEYGPSYVMLLGPLLSTVATSTAQVSHNWNITQLGIQALAPVLSNRKRFPRFYRLSPPDRKMNAARIGLMKTFNWKKVATLHQAAKVFSETINDFVDDIQSNNISIVSQQVYMNDPFTQVKNLKDHDARIIFAMMYKDSFMEVLCAAYRVGLYGPKVVWFNVGYLPHQFWMNPNERVDCTVEELEQAVEGLIMFKFTETDPNIGRGIANYTYEEFITEFRNHTDYKPDKKAFEQNSGDCFDSVWLAAMGLNCTVSKLQEIGHPKTLDEATYLDSVIHDVVFKCLGQSSILGLGGKLFFPDGGDPDGVVIIERIQNAQREVIAYHSEFWTTPFQWIDGALKWKDGVVPRDSTVVIQVEDVIQAPVYATMCTLSVSGILLSITFISFNIFFNEKRVIKRSSPNINNILLAGCIICYCNVFIKPIEITSNFTCMANVVSLCTGFTVIYGCLLSKVWRVFKIFTYKTQTTHVSDKEMYFVIGGFVCIHLVVLAVWEMTSPHVLTVRFDTNEIYTVGNDEEVHPYVRICSSVHGMYFYLTIYILEGVFLLFGAFLALESRNVKVINLNDSKQVGLCIYNILILSAVALALVLLLGDKEVMLYGVVSSCLLFGTTVTQLLIFVPKVYALFTMENNDNQTSVNLNHGIHSRQQRKDTRTNEQLT